MPKDWTPAPWSRAVEDTLQSKQVHHDLTISSPWNVGLGWDSDLLKEWLVASNPFQWQPSPRGALGVREFLTTQYEGTSPEHFFLTAGTGDAYSALFKVLCNPGDTILVPRPGYPLLDVLAELDGVQVQGYSFVYEQDRWALDVDSLSDKTQNVKAVLVVEPSNPLGSYLNKQEWDALGSFCQQQGAALIVDEVFASWNLQQSCVADFQALSQHIPVFRLDGLSKRVGLPQVKLSWICAQIPSDQSILWEALEYCLDAYLNLSSLAQALALPALEHQEQWQLPLRQHLQTNAEWLQAWALQQQGLVCPKIQGGWYASLHLSGIDDESLCVEALFEHGVLTQPGYFFDFAEDQWVVISLLPQLKDLQKGLELLLHTAASQRERA